ncbi:MAG TPA: ribonuclease III [Anaerovoracaceae bacterium]|nr:ribonuclease III [Anaerovoracaceae bacterium]
MNNAADFQKMIGYEFQNPTLLKEALTHSSAANEKHSEDLNCNERLEFLGDAVLDLAVSRYLYDTMIDLSEGELSKLRSLVVCERSLSDCGQRLKIDEFIDLSRGEELSGGRKRPSIIADAVEALIGSVYLDGGFDAATSFVITIFNETIKKALSGELYKDYKTEIQELLQSKGKTDIKYVVDREKGPDHNKTFYISLWCHGIKLGVGEGKSKKEAEQNAAKAALEVEGVVF